MGYGRRHTSPLNSGLWIITELILTVSQIVAAVIVLCLSRHEHPHAPLFQWIVGYASGCVATLPLFWWRWHYRNQASESDLSQARRESTRNNPLVSFSTLTVTRTSEGEGGPTATASRGAQSVGIPNPRYELLNYCWKLNIFRHAACECMLLFEPYSLANKIDFLLSIGYYLFLWLLLLYWQYS